MKDARRKALERMAKSYAPKVGTKAQALEYYKAKKGKKKLPTFIHRSKMSESEMKYKALSIKEWEEKYGKEN